MREIRFRGKRKDNGEWVYGYLIGKDVIVGDIVEFCEEYFNCEYWWKVDPETVGQYTGLHDRNGREIYEGDILKCELYFGAVEWIEDWAMFAINNNRLESLILWASVSEVIGNIYENPELLKGEETA